MMARPVQIILDGFRGQVANYDLGPRMVFLGGVGTGKSSVIDGLRFAALGFVPYAGRSEAATAAFLPQDRDEMKVAVRLDDERYFSRTLKRKGKGFTSVAEASWVDVDATQTEVSDAIVSLFGSTIDEAAECLDLRALLGAAPGDRSRKIEALLSATDSATPEETTSRIMEDVVCGLVGMDKVLRGPAVFAIRESLSEEVRTVLSSVEYAILAEVREGGVPAAIKGLKMRTSGIARSLRTAKAAQEKIQGRLQSLGTPPGTMEEMRGKLDTVLAEQGAAEERLRAHAKAQEGRDRAEARIASLEEQIRKAIEEEAPARETEIERLTAIVDAPPMIWDEEALRVAEEEKAEAKRLWHEASTDRLKKPEGPRPNLDAAEAALEIAQKRLDDALCSPWNIVKSTAFGMEQPLRAAGAWEVVEADVKLILDICRQNSSDTKVLRPRRDELAEEAAKIAKEREAWDEALTAYEEAEAAYRKADAVYTKMTQAVEAVVAGIAQRDAADAVQRQEAVRKRDVLAAEARMAEEVLAGYRSDLEEARRIQEEEGAEPPLPTTDEVVERAGQIDTIRAAMEEAQKNAALYNELSRLGDQIDEQIQTQEVLGKAKKAAVAERNRTIGSRSGGILDLMEKVLRKAMFFAKPYVEATRTKIDFGWDVDGGGRVPLSALSGGEASSYLSALAAAVIAVREPEVSILAVEGAEVGAERLPDLLLGLDEVGGTVGTILTATVTPPVTVPGNWTEVRVDA